MTENMKDEIKMENIEIENIEIKKEIDEEMLPSSTVEDTCTVYIKEEDVKVEIGETKGKT